VPRIDEKAYIACSMRIEGAMIKEHSEKNGALLTHKIRIEFEQVATN
jgi:hypothetical protein